MVFLFLFLKIYINIIYTDRITSEISEFTIQNLQKVIYFYEKN